MTDWQVNLEMVEGGASKFWRARVDGGTLYVNFGRIGTQGQTQMKNLGSAEACTKELEKLEREKRKKGYHDAGSAGAGEGAASVDEELEAGEEEEGEENEGEDRDEEEEEGAEEKRKPAAAAAGLNLSLDAPDRKVDLRLVQSGATVRMVAVERYSSPAEAQKALSRLKAAFEAEGYRGAPSREL